MSDAAVSSNRRTASSERPALLRRMRVPLIVLPLPIILAILAITFDRLELIPQAIMPLFMAATITMELAFVILAIWFLFFSGLTLVTKAIGVLLLALIVAGLYAIPRRWEWSSKMQPIPVLRWQPDLQADLDKRLEQGHEPAQLNQGDLEIASDDFPRYRGFKADGIAPAIALPTNWEGKSHKVVWQTSVGWSYSGIAVAGTVAITIEQRKDKEAVVCYDRATGKELWAYEYPAFFEQSGPMGGNGPRATPTIDGGDVFSLGAKGDLVCLNGINGEPRWKTNIVTDNGAKVVKWGMTSSPLMIGDLVVVNPGIDPKDTKNQAVAAYDRKTGTTVWAAGKHVAGYSSPMLAKLAHFEQIVLFDAGGVAGIDPANGAEMWRHSWDTWEDMNIIQPVIVPGDRVFISSQLSNGGALLQVTRSGSTWSVKEIWKAPTMASNFANPVYHDGHIYGISNTFLCCIDVANGKRLWKGERVGGGQLLLTGNTLLVQTEGTGEIVVVAADPTDYRELARFQVFKGNRTWNTPSLAGGRLFVRNHEEMLCIELPR